MFTYARERQDAQNLKLLRRYRDASWRACELHVPVQETRVFQPPFVALGGFQVDFSVKLLEAA